jgi:hypothetical protein
MPEKQKNPYFPRLSALAILGGRSWHWFLAQAMNQGRTVMAKFLYVRSGLSPVQTACLADFQNVHIVRTL